MGKRKSAAGSTTRGGSIYQNIDHRAAEKELAFLERYFAGRAEPAPEEIRQQLDNFINGIVPIDYQSALTQAQLAQDAAYDAFACSGKSKRIKLAREALAISQDCPDAYLILAEDEAATVEEAVPLLRQGLAAGKRVLGEPAFTTYKGDFRKRISTRPYLRILFSLAECLAMTEAFAEAINLYHEALELDSSDYYGAKNALIPLLVAAGMYGDALAFISQHGVRNTKTLYSKALASFALHGDTIASQDALNAALLHNSHVIACLTDYKKTKPFSGAEPGSFEEASSYVFEAASYWFAIEGALAWMAKSISATITRKTVDDIFPGLRNVPPDVLIDPDELIDDAISDVLSASSNK